MIAAVGRVPMGKLVEALKLMASNSNASHDHEFRDRRSDFLHDCGWGSVHAEKGRLIDNRSARSCLDDGRFNALAGLETDLTLLHARRTPDRETIAAENSHPFLAASGGETWAFCHNGATDDVSGLSSAPDLSPRGSTDSERLFHHVLAGLDPSDRRRSLGVILGGLRGFTCLNSFLATAGRVTVYARAGLETARPRYYTLWHGTGEGLAIASSEPFPLRGVDWDAVPDGTCFELNIDS